MRGDSGFAAATRDYSAWLGHFMTLRPAGLAHKAEEMRRGRFAFFRGTFYRWRAQFGAVGERIAAATATLSAGDVHLENFATWRDAEGRLAWGISDFDEAARIPFTSDLVRLATSIVLERGDMTERLRLDSAEAIAAVLDGYRAGLQEGGPFILEAEHRELRLAAEAEYKPRKEWEKIRRRGTEETPPTELRDLLVASLPDDAIPRSLRAVDDKGLGSLGRPRWVLVAEWHGGPLAREAKAAAPSAWRMGEPDHPDPIADHRQALLPGRRARDPALRVVTRAGASWVVRRLSPEARKIGLDADAQVGSQDVLLRAMGADVANLHAGASEVPRRLREYLSMLDAEEPGWLLHAAQACAERVEVDRAEFERDPGVVAEMPEG
jgi:hypothetical protein